MKWSRKFKFGIMAGCVIATIACMIIFLMDTERFYVFYMIIVCVILTAWVFYYPVIKARKGAKQVARIRGTYDVTITDEGMVSFAGNPETPLAYDKYSRAVELSDSFAVRVDSGTTFCIPKSAMRPSQIEAVREIFKEYIKFESYVK